MSRTPQEVFAAHVGALASADLPALLLDNTDDAVLLAPDGPRRGREQIEQFFAVVLRALPNATFHARATVFDADALLLVWSADSASARITDAVDTFVFADDQIRLQTTAFTLQTTS
jgi:SnoaL-like domain